MFQYLFRHSDADELIALAQVHSADVALSPLIGKVTKVQRHQHVGAANGCVRDVTCILHFLLRYHTLTQLSGRQAFRLRIINVEQSGVREQRQQLRPEWFRRPFEFENCAL
jgi:hypothetical protein